jgi:hypothetical protein
LVCLSDDWFLSDFSSQNLILALRSFALQAARPFWGIWALIAQPRDLAAGGEV